MRNLYYFAAANPKRAEARAVRMWSAKSAESG